MILFCCHHPIPHFGLSIQPEQLSGLRGPIWQGSEPECGGCNWTVSRTRTDRRSAEALAVTALTPVKWETQTSAIAQTHVDIDNTTLEALIPLSFSNNQLNFAVLSERLALRNIVGSLVGGK